MSKRRLRLAAELQLRIPSMFLLISISRDGCEVLSSMAEVTIDIIKNGPYIVKGSVELKDAAGNNYPTEQRMALCRCGASTEKPFCDGTHSKIGFQAAEKAVPESAENRS
jgi:CDGSH-type Zn-finger protein